MNRVVVDTDAFSRIAFSATRPSLARHLEGKIPMLSFATVAEVYFGAAKSNWGTRRIKELDEVVRCYVIVPFDSELPKLWGSLKARAQAAGHPLGQPSQSNDRWICATAIHHDARRSAADAEPSPLYGLP